MKYLMSFFLFFTITAQNIYAISPSRHKIIDIETYKLIQINSSYFLNIAGQKSNTPIPSEWLLNKKPIDDRLEKHISLNKFKSQITAFVIDNKDKLVGLHLSSYDIHDFGKQSSPGAAGGKDIFLIYERKTRKIYNSHLDFGTSKMRLKYGRCFYGKFSHFYLHQLPLRDGSYDLGVQIEEAKCTEHNVKNKIIKGIPRYYNMGPIKWFKFKNKNEGWVYIDTVIRDIKADNFIGNRDMWKLPLIEMSKTPVDYVMFLRKVGKP